MPEYRFDMGNSNEGESGYVAYVTQKDPKSAALKLQMALSLESGVVAVPIMEGLSIHFCVNLDAITAEKAELVD